MPRKRSTGTTGPFTVGGQPDRSYPTEGVAFSLAITRATQADEPRRFGVFENGQQIGRVERHEDGLITIHGKEHES